MLSQGGERQSIVHIGSIPGRRIQKTAKAAKGIWFFGDEVVMDHETLLPLSTPAPVSSKSKLVFQRDVIVVDRRPRKMTIEACDATLMVAHAMDYLTDSRELPSGKVIALDQSHPDVYALQLLMEAKYQIYTACPVIERRRSTLAGLFKGKDRRKQP